MRAPPTLAHCIIMISVTVISPDSAGPGPRALGRPEAHPPGPGPDPLSSSQRRSPAPLPAPSQRLRRDPLGHAGRAPGKVEPITRLAGPAGNPEPKAPRSNPAQRSSSPMATRRRARRRASVRPRIFVCVPSSTYFCQLDITGQGIYIHCRQPPEF